MSGRIKEIVPFLQLEECRRIGIYIGSLQEKQELNPGILMPAQMVIFPSYLRKKKMNRKIYLYFV